MKKPVIFLIFCLALTPWLLVAQDKDFGDLSLDSLLSVKVSTVSKYEQFTSEAPSSITVITKEDIKAYGYQNLEQLFNSVSGFYTSNDRNYSYLGLRGFSRPSDYNNRFLVLINGYVLNDNVYNSVVIGNAFSMVAMEDIEQIEIVKGPGSVLYGTSALFAVINIITRTGAGLDGLNASVEVGSFERKYGNINYGKKFDNELDIALSANWGEIEGQDLYFEEYDQPENNDGIAVGLDREEFFGGNFRMKYKGLKLLLAADGRLKDIPTAAYETDFNDRSYTFDHMALVGLSYTKKINARSSCIAKSYLNNLYYNGVYLYDGEPYNDLSKGTYAGIDVQYLNDFAENHRLVVGMEYQNHFKAYHKASDNYNTYVDQNFPYHISSFYIQDEYNLTSNLAFIAGLRYDKHSELDGGLTPRAALIYHPSKNTSLKALYGQAFRNPNIFERRVGDGLSFIPNINLKREQVKTMEIVIEQHINRNIQATFNMYSNHINNLIDQVTNEDMLLQYQNISNVISKGIEAELRLNISGIKGYASYSFQVSENKDTGEELTNSPAHLVKSGVNFPLTRFVTFGMENFYETERLTVYNTKSDPFWLCNININISPFPKANSNILNGITLAAKINNVFDANYGLPGGFEHIQNLIYQNGRNFTLRLNINF